MTPLLAAPADSLGVPQFLNPESIMSTQKSTGTDLHQEITNQVIAAIEAGTEKFDLPWHKVGPNLSIPVNATTGKAYNGINILALWSANLKHGFTENRWATYRQWQGVEAQVVKGQRSTGILFCKPLVCDEEKTSDDKEHVRWMSRRASVFNLAQTDGYEPPVLDLANQVEPCDAAEALIRATGAKVENQGDRAFYSPTIDSITIPPRNQFKATSNCTASEAYYSTLLHELVHWTGAEQRLDRPQSNGFRTPEYAFEELVAELGAAFLCAELGISLSPKPENAAYCANWLKLLKDDSRALTRAASQASKAVAYLKDLAGY